MYRANTLIGIHTLLGVILLCSLLSFNAISQTPASGNDKLNCEDNSGTSPGLYVTVDQSQVYLDQDDQRVELKPGEAAFAGEDFMHCLNEVPGFLNWPCGTPEAGQITRFPSYSVADLGAGKSIQTVIDRYFDLPEIIDPPIEWLNGDYHTSFKADEIALFASPEYWYIPAGEGAFASGKRPETALISLFWSTRQVLMDSNSFNELKKLKGNQPIPVAFVFNGENVVPVSYFGSDVSLEVLSQAFFGSGVKLADVPVWYAGDHHLSVSIAEFEELFDIPDISEIGAENLASMTSELDRNGFRKKPIIVSMMSENSSMVIDQPDRIRAAASLGIDSIPTVIFYYEKDSHMARCGLSLPQVDSGSGIGSFSAPPAVELLVPRPKPERPASRN
jgi:hypothetical protein